MGMAQIILLIFISMGIGANLYRFKETENTDYVYAIINRLTILLLVWWGGFFS